MLLLQAIEHRDPDEVSRLSERVPRQMIQRTVLPDLTIESRTWFWQLVTDEEQFDQLISSMHQAAFQLLTNGGFAFGVDFSVAPLNDFCCLLVTEDVDAFLAENLPSERYATLQLILRFIEEDGET